MMILLSLFFQKASANATDSSGIVEQIKHGEFYDDLRKGRSINIVYNQQHLLQEFSALANLNFDFDQSNLVIIKMQQMGGSPQAFISIGKAHFSQNENDRSVTYLNIPIIYHYYANLSSNKEEGCVSLDVLNHPYVAIKVPKTGYQLLRFEEQRQQVNCH